MYVYINIIQICNFHFDYFYLRRDLKGIMAAAEVNRLERDKIPLMFQVKDSNFTKPFEIVFKAFK